MGNSTSFKKGVTGNPQGLSRTQRNEREDVRRMLKEACKISGSDKDELIEAIKDGILDRNPAIIKIACEYRWGRATQHVTVEKKEPKDMSKDELAELVPEALAALGVQWAQA